MRCPGSIAHLSIPPQEKCTEYPQGVGYHPQVGQTKGYAVLAAAKSSGLGLTKRPLRAEGSPSMRQPTLAAAAAPATIWIRIPIWIYI